MAITQIFMLGSLVALCRSMAIGSIGSSYSPHHSAHILSSPVHHVSPIYEPPVYEPTPVYTPQTYHQPHTNTYYSEPDPEPLYKPKPTYIPKHEQESLYKPKPTYIPEPTYVSDVKPSYEHEPYHAKTTFTSKPVYTSEPYQHKPLIHESSYKPTKYRHEAPKSYSFGYGVKDAYSGANFGHSEKSDGNAVHGSYTVALPDGRIQKVTYTADKHNGFRAHVSYEGEAQFPKYEPHHKPSHNPHYQPAYTF